MSLSDAESTDTLVAVKPESETIRIGLIADTHIPADTKMLPPHVQEAFKDVDLILHAGDIYVPRVLDDLETIAPVLAARGNGDWKFPSDHRLNRHHILSINGLTLGLTHALNYYGSPLDSLDKVIEQEFGKRIDIIVSGDTHVALIESYNDILLVNSGSPTLPNGLFQLGTVGLLEIIRGRVEARIVQLSDFSLPFHRELIYHQGGGT